MLQVVANGVIGVIAVLHIWFLILEMFLFQKPIGLQTFAITPEKAEIMATLAANQGLYNGFLAAGLITSFFFKNPEVTVAFQLFFLGCVMVAGLYGAWSVSKDILFFQFVPALIGFVLVFLTLPTTK